MAKRRYFTVDIYYNSGGFCSTVRLDAHHDGVNGVPVTTKELAAKYVKQTLILPNEEKWFSIR